MVLDMVEKDMAKARTEGATVVAINTIIDDSDGCAVQYRCGTSLFMNWKLSMERREIYHKNIDMAGHRKSWIDSKNGQNKGKLTKKLSGNVSSQPEAYVEGKNTIIYVDMDQNGKRVDFADVAAKYLNNDELSGKVSANHPRIRADNESSKKIIRSEALVRKAGVAKFDGIKMVAELEPHKLGRNSKNNGIGEMKHFIFDPELERLVDRHYIDFICCHIVCYCKWCVEQFKKSTAEERYGNPRTGCVLWPMMEIRDEDGNSTGKGYNDWVFGKFVERKDSSHKQYHASLRDMNMKTGRRYASEILDGSFGAYMVDGESSPFYIVQ